jgi:hypothetical protein
MAGFVLITMQHIYLRVAPILLPLLELALMLASGALILRARRQSPHAGPSSFRFLEPAFRRLARRRMLAAVAVGCGVVAIRAALIPWLGIPQPLWHDEFSYLLAADTFAHGRITNPTHPMWIHFETFHVIQHPTYMSMYPPAAGLVLAFGQRLGRPWLGQLFITGAMGWAICWMLQGWVPPTWALLGGILAALRLGILSYWMNSYWCASVVAFAGALVLGAWPRLRRHLSIGESVTMGLGLVILANSRPYEGFIFSLPIAAAMAIWLTGRRRPALLPAFARVILPILAVLILGGLATGFYYYRVTGSPFVMTYQVNRSQYAAAPYFVWQHAQPAPEYHHVVMRDYYRRELGDFERNQTFDGYFERSGNKIVDWWRFYLGPLLTVPLLALPRIVRDRKMRLPLFICAAMVLAFSVQTWTLAHYFSAATGALYILLVQGLRHLAQWRRGSDGLGRSVVRAVPLLACAMILLRVSAVAMHAHIEPEWPRGNLQRARILRQLRQFPGDQLVLVRHGNRHDLDREWVWNRASIDKAKVVWARDMGPQENQELIDYFKCRTVWQLNEDDSSPRLEPYKVAH